MATPYKVGEVTGGNPLGRVFGGGRKHRTTCEIENLLARSERVTNVTAEQLADVAARNGLDLGRSMAGARKELYRRYLEHCLDDHCLSVDESADLAHLRSILHVEDAVAAGVHDQATRALYGAAIDRVLDDQKLDPEEKEFLERLRHDLELEEATAAEMLRRGTERARYKYIAKTEHYDGGVLSSQEVAMELSGESATTIEDAVNAGLEDACRAVPDISRVVVSEISADIADGQVKRWQVKFKAGLSADS